MSAGAARNRARLSPGHAIRFGPAPLNYTRLDIFIYLKSSLVRCIPLPANRFEQYTGGTDYAQGSAWLAIVSACGVPCLFAQTTQGLISGSIVNSVTGRPISGASIAYESPALSASGTYQSDAGGYYFLPLLSTGTYSVRATAAGYQSQELQELDLPVAGRIQIDFKLRPLSDVWEAGNSAAFIFREQNHRQLYGPDVDTSRSGTFEGQQGTLGTLDTSVSYVVDPVQIEDLPLQGRDVYTMLVSLPA